MMCGIACLQMVCAYHGKKLSQSSLSAICHATKEGVSLLAINDAAVKIGFLTDSMIISEEGLSAASLPCILHWNQNHFVVLYKVEKKRIFHIADPGKDLTSYTKDEFLKHWANACTNGEGRGIAMFLSPSDKFYENTAMESEGQTPSPHSMRFIGHYACGYKRQFLIILLTLLIGSLLQLLMPFLTQGIVDWGVGRKDIQLIWLILSGELAIVVGRTFTDFVRRRLLLRISTQVNIALVSDFFAKLLRLPMSFFDTKLMGDLLQRMNDHARVQSFLTSQALNVMFTGISFIVFGSVLAFYDLTIFAVFAVGSLAYSLWAAHFFGQRRVIDSELFEQQAVSQSKTHQFFSAIQEIKTQQCERRRCEEWEQTQQNLFGIQTKSLQLQQKQEVGGVIINEIKDILITALAASAVIEGDITLGMMLATQYIVGQLNSPVEQLMSFSMALQDVKMSLRRINEIRQKKDEDYGRDRRSYATPKKHLELKGISFRYDTHSRKKTIDGLSLKIPAGKVTAIVGASGSGKTTLLKLLLGYYAAESGSITLAGCDIKEYNLRWWRSQCGVVMQDGVIFSESIERNIAVGDGEIDHERLEQASRIACIYDFVASLPLGFKTIIGADGIGLSQGQKQRILIARAAYKDPDFIFLDEATNSLDANNERTIAENLIRFYAGKTVIIVAHRLSTVRNADQIVAIDGGKVVESGTHDELISRRGLYFNLVKNQLELGS